MADRQNLQIDKQMWNRFSFYINVVIFLVVAVFLYLLILDCFNAGRLSTTTDTLLLSNAWVAVARDVAFVAVGFVVIFVQLFLSYRKLSLRSF
jgi:hypothetical protein